MADVQEFKCPQCGGKLEFDAATQQMLCPFCGGSFDPKAIPNPQQTDSPQWQSAQQDWSDDEAGTLKTYLCDSCGGEILTEATTAATACPYCGNPVVMTDRVSGTLRPDYVIPFKVTEEEAKKALKTFACKHRFAPNRFRRENTLKEIRGVYVPFWLFDSSVYASVQFEGKKVRTWTEGNYDCREISYYDVIRAGDMRFENIPVDGSTKMPDDLMNSIEPFSFAEAVDFKTSYLSGFLADKYDVDMQDCMKCAAERTRTSAQGALTGTVTGYSSVSVKHSEMQIKPERSKYALYPVWLLNTQFRGQTYRFAMNGQSGKFIGNLPISRAKLAVLFGSVAVTLTGVLWALGFGIGLY